jgi:hypothetical protein
LRRNRTSFRQSLCEDLERLSGDSGVRRRHDWLCRRVQDRSRRPRPSLERESSTEEGTNTAG